MCSVYTLHVHMSSSGLVIHYIGRGQSSKPEEISVFQMGICDIFQEHNDGVKWDLPILQCCLMGILCLSKYETDVHIWQTPHPYFRPWCCPYRMHLSLCVTVRQPPIFEMMNLDNLLVLYVSIYINWVAAAGCISPCIIQQVVTKISVICTCFVSSCHVSHW